MLFYISPTISNCLLNMTMTILDPSLCTLSYSTCRITNASVQSTPVKRMSSDTVATEPDLGVPRVLGDRRSQIRCASSATLLVHLKVKFSWRSPLVPEQGEASAPDHVIRGSPLGTDGSSSALSNLMMNLKRANNMLLNLTIGSF